MRLPLFVGERNYKGKKSQRPKAPLWLRFEAPKKRSWIFEEWFLWPSFYRVFLTKTWHWPSVNFREIRSAQTYSGYGSCCLSMWVLLWLVNHWNENKCILSLEYSKKLFLGTIEERSVPINHLTVQGELLKEALNQETMPKEEFHIIGSKKANDYWNSDATKQTKTVPIFSHHMQWFRLPYGNLDPDPWPFPSGLSGKLDENDRFRIYTLVTWNFSN